MGIPFGPLMDAAAMQPVEDFYARITRYTSGVFLVRVAMALPDGRFHATCEMSHAPATRTFTHTADGRTYHVVIDIAADGSGTANFEVVENEVKIAGATKTLPPAPAQEPSHYGPYQRLGLGSNVKAPVVIERVEPVLPSRPPQAASITGIVILEALINDRGTVDGVKVLKGLPFGLDQAAAEAVEKWTFQPATRDDRPVPVVVQLVVNFPPA